MHYHTSKYADFLVKIDMNNKIDSLNISNSGSIVFHYLKNNYEISKNFYKLTKKNDLIINMGAGDCHYLWSILNNKKTK